MTPSQETQYRSALRLLAGAPGAVHLMGAGGVGVAGLARLLQARGWMVTGCDATGGRVADWLVCRGIPVASGHDPAHVRDPAVNWLIRTAAVRPDHPEVAAAEARGLPVNLRGTVLPALLAQGASIAVAGTHGKTTTSAMIAHILRAEGLNPAFCIGGEVEALGGVAAAGAGEWTVAEADESDGTLAWYAPAVAVINNVEFDHMEHFSGVEEFFAVFERFARQARRRLIYGGDDAGAVRAAASVPDAVAFGFGPEADLRAADWCAAGFGQTFTLWIDGAPACPVNLPVPGRFNALNALAAIAAAREAGVAPVAAARHLAGFQPARRRMEKFFEGRGLAVYSDYAHHPSEIRALLSAVRTLPHARVWVVFQPHRYTRTLALGRDFPPAFGGVHEVVLVPVYAASEDPLVGGTSGDLLEHFRAAGMDRVRLADSLAAAWNRVRPQLQPGDLLLVVGAGDVEDVARMAARDLAVAATP